MSWTTDQYVTVAAVVLLIASAPLMWQIADVRAAQAVDHKQSDSNHQQVAARQGPTDYDGDGIINTLDRCPTRPEVQNGFHDHDGCPDVVGTTGAS